MILGTITLGLEVSMIVMCITIHKLSNEIVIVMSSFAVCRWDAHRS